MKKTILGILLVLSTGLVQAEPAPIKKDLVLKNKNFSELIYKALEKKASKVVTGGKTVLNVLNVIQCSRIVGFASTDYSCRLLKNAWLELGENVYSTVDKETVPTKLYDILSVKPLKEEGMSFKNIELDEDDQNGGTERNLLTCTRVSPEVAEMGFRDTCQLVDGM